MRRRRHQPDRSIVYAGRVQVLVAQALEVTLDEITGPTRDLAHIAFARQVAMYLTHTHYGVSLTRTGAAFGRERTTVAYACRIIEEARENPDVDFVVEGLIGLLQTLKSRRRRPKTDCAETPCKGEHHAALGA